MSVECEASRDMSRSTISGEVRQNAEKDNERKTKSEQCEDFSKKKKESAS